MSSRSIPESKHPGWMSPGAAPNLRAACHGEVFLLLSESVHQIVHGGISIARRQRL